MGLNSMAKLIFVYFFVCLNNSSIKTYLILIFMISFDII